MRSPASRRRGIRCCDLRGAEPAQAIRFAFILRFMLHSAYLFQSGRLCAACGDIIMPAENFSIGSPCAKEAAISGVCCASWGSFAHRLRRETPAGAARRAGDLLRLYSAFYAAQCISISIGAALRRLRRTLALEAITLQKPRFAACVVHLGRASLTVSGGKRQRALPAALAIRFAFIMRFMLHGTYLFQSGRLCAAC